MNDAIYISEQEVAVAVQRYMTWLTGCRPTRIGFDYQIDWYGPLPTGGALQGAEGRDDLGYGFPDANDKDRLIAHWQKTEAVLLGLLEHTSRKFDPNEKDLLNSEIGGLSKNLLDLLAELLHVAPVRDAPFSLLRIDPPSVYTV